MTGTPTGQRRRVWPWIVALAVVAMLVFMPEARDQIILWMGYIAAVIVGVFLTAMLMIGPGKGGRR